MKKRSRSNSYSISHTESESAHHSFLAAPHGSLNSSPGPRPCGKSSFLPKRAESPPMSLFSNFQELLASPYLSNNAAYDKDNIHHCNFGISGTPATPVDIRSVPQVRQLSSKKVIYSYTFGPQSGSEESTPRPITRSPSKNCRQNLKSNKSHQFKLESSSAAAATATSSRFRK